MRTRSVVVRDVAAKNSAEMLLAEDDDVVEAFSPDGPDEALAVCVLPR